MALPPLSQKITLEGAEQVKSQVRQIGDAAENAFGRVKSAVDGVNLDGFNSQFSASTEKMIAAGTVLGALAVAAFKLGEKFASMAGEAAKAASSIGRAAEGAGQSLKNFQQVGFGLQQIGLTSQEANQAMSKFGADGIKNITDGLAKLKSAGLVFAPTAAGAEQTARQLGQLAEKAALAGQKLTPFEEVMRRSKAQLDLTTGAVKQTPEAWQEFANSILKIKEPMEQIKTLSAIFGEELGRRMAARLKEGGSALQKEFEDFNKLGLGVTDAQRKIADEFEKAQQRLAAVREKANRDTGLALAPFLTPIIDGLATQIANANKAIDDGLAAAAKSVKEEWGRVKAFFTSDFSFADVVAAIQAEWDKFDLSGRFSRELQAIRNDFANTVDSIVQGWETITSAINRAIGALSDFISKRTDGAISNPAGDPTGFASGGYTGRGGVFEPAGIVHRGEYVQPQHVVHQPGVLAFLETLRRTGDLQATISRFVNGFSRGGFVDGIGASFAMPRMPSFADGGLVPAGSVGGGLHPVTINFEGRRVSGLFAPSDVVKQLTKASVIENAASAGKPPRWDQ